MPGPGDKKPDVVRQTKDMYQPKTPSYAADTTELSPVELADINPRATFESKFAEAQYLDQLSSALNKYLGKIEARKDTNISQETRAEDKKQMTSISALVAVVQEFSEYIQHIMMFSRVANAEQIDEKRLQDQIFFKLPATVAGDLFPDRPPLDSGLAQKLKDCFMASLRRELTPDHAGYMKARIIMSPENNACDEFLTKVSKPIDPSETGTFSV